MFLAKSQPVCLFHKHERWKEPRLVLYLTYTRVYTYPVQGRPPLVQCPLNKHHFVPRDSLETHTLNCRYAALGINPKTEVRWIIPNFSPALSTSRPASYNCFCWFSLLQDMPTDGRPFYKTDIPCVEISKSLHAQFQVVCFVLATWRITIAHLMPPT